MEYHKRWILFLCLIVMGHDSLHEEGISWLEALWGTRFPDYPSGTCGSALVPIIFLWKTILLLKKRHYGKQSTQPQPTRIYINNFTSNPLMNAMEKYSISCIMLHGYPSCTDFGNGCRWFELTSLEAVILCETALSFESVIWLCNPKTAGEYWISLLL